MEHSLSCPKGGFPHIRQNEVRDTVGNWLSEVCSDVCIELPLQPITGETLRGAPAITTDGARLGIAANGFEVVRLNGLTLMLYYSTLMLPATANKASPPRARLTSDSRSGPMNNEYAR